MKRLIIIFLLLSTAGICSADYELRLNDGVTLTWREYIIEDSQYCTQKDLGKICIQKSDVVALKEIKDKTGNAPHVYKAKVSAHAKHVTPKNANGNPGAGESKPREKLVDENKEVLTVNIVSAIPGKIYLDGYYTGKSTPAVVNMSNSGLHTIGLGGDNNRYQEIKINATARQADVRFNNSGWLSARTWKIMLLSVRNMYLEGNTQAHLTDNDITEAYNSILKTSQEWIKDYTYGLAEWNVEKMTVENVYGHFQYDPGTGKHGDQIDDGRLLHDANLMWLLDKYDSVLVFWPSVADGSDSDPKGGCRGLCCFQGKSLVVPNICGRVDKWTERMGNSQIWIHEWLHTVEGKYRDRGFNAGKNGVHGAEIHGYSYDNQNGWLRWYKDFMRGQVSEDGKFAGIPPSAWISSEQK